MGTELRGLWEGWRFGRDERLYAPGWRRGLEPGEILGLPYLMRLDKVRDQKTAELAARVAKLEHALAVAEEATRRYRRLVTLEARIGLMLTSIDD